MSWSPEDINDRMVMVCEREHVNEPNLYCAYCIVRAEQRVCARCEVDLEVDDCECPVDEQAPLLVDGFGRALVVPETPAMTGDEVHARFRQRILQLADQHLAGVRS